MVNDRLRTAMEAAGLTIETVATRLGVDAKTVERWIAAGRLPYPRHRIAFAKLVGGEAGELWPTARETETTTAQDLIRLYPSRASVPTHLWFDLLEASNQAVDLLFYSALFLADGHAELAAAIRRAAIRGAQVRILVGNPRSEAVFARGREEGIGPDLASRVRMTLHYLEGIDRVEGVQVRGHSTTLYNSIYRFDDKLLVNAHTFGAAAVESPVLQIQRAPSGRLFDHYMRSFERVWAASAPILSAFAREETRGSHARRYEPRRREPNHPTVGQREPGEARRRNGSRRKASPVRRANG
jgi:transcriptional regulator with XRE-family HTH domain